MHVPSETPVDACIALGSNLGDREATLRRALVGIAVLPGTRLVAASGFLETAPVGPPQPAYLNAAAHVATSLAPRELLGHLLRIEREHGRDRSRGGRWGSRPLDLDLLTHGETVMDEPGLTLPHPRLHERAFVLEPLAQIAPGLRIAGLGRTVAELLRDLRVASGGAR
ncbi:MAG: 2-amino-4-hydroxy-6-hydroxymethyldihydropteridine diphosphokinase [Phycisphaerales bacterium]